MKKARRWLAVFLCGALALTMAACGAGGDGSQASGTGGGGGAPTATGGQGRYRETDITPPGVEGENLHSFLAEDGSLVCFTSNLDRQFTSTDGGSTWEEADGPGAGGVLEGSVTACTRLEDGSLLVALGGADGGVSGLMRLAPDGTAQPYPVAALDEAIETGPSTHVNHLQALPQNRLLLGFMSGDFMPAGAAAADDSGSEEGGSSDVDASETDDESTSENEGGGNFVVGSQSNFVGLLDAETGELIAEYPEWYGVAATANEETLFLLDYNGEIQAKALASGKAQPQNEGQVPVAEYDFGLVMAAGPDGVFVLNGEQLQKLGAGGEVAQVLDGSNYSISDVSARPRALHLLPEGDFVAHMLGEAGSRLYRYHWDETAVVDPNSILKVWALEDNSLVRAAITALRRQNPDALVQFEVALSQDGGLTAEDAIKTLNTRLLNGDGPDVILLDGCPMESYAARGMLQDLSGAVDTSGMFQNLAAPFTGEEGTYYLPTSVQLPLLLGTQANLRKAATLAQLTQLIQDGRPLPETGPNDDVFAALPEDQQPVLAPGELREMYDLLWNSSAGTVITPEGLNTEALGEMLDALKNSSDKYGMEDGVGAAGGSMAMSSGSGVVASVSGSALAYTTGRAILGAYTANSVQMLNAMLQPSESAMASFPGLSSGSFVPVGVVGVSADSERSELAAQFVNLMLSEEVQAVPVQGFPVTEAGMQKQIADIDQILQENQGQAFELDYQTLMNLATTPQISDKVVSEMVWNVAQALCRGEVDVEGAVTQLEQELGNYLAERQ